MTIGMRLIGLAMSVFRGKDDEKIRAQIGERVNTIRDQRLGMRADPDQNLAHPQRKVHERPHEGNLAHPAVTILRERCGGGTGCTDHAFKKGIDR
jgi:hypothetical protein